MSNDVFNRFEKKYILNQSVYEHILSELKKHMTLDRYNIENNFYTISNIYYDTADDLLIRKSLSKPVFKEKLRLRAYGQPSDDSKVYLEIKKKYKGHGNKRRTALTLSEAYQFLETKVLPAPKPYHNSQVLRELQFFLSQYDLKPAVYIAYDRMALSDGDLRITFDKNIRTRRCSLGLEQGQTGELLLPEGSWLMEIKAQNTLPMWLVRILSENRIYASSFSKYGKEYENTLKNRRGDEVTCLSHYLVPQQVAR